MRAFRKLFSMFAAAVISLVAVSCSLFGDEEPSAERNFVEPALTASVSGSVEISGAAPGALRSSAARTALPSLNGVSYSVEASDGGSPYEAEVDAENLSFSFEDLAVVEGGTEYTITATGTVSGIEVVSGNCTVTLRPGDALVEDITVKPCAVSESGKVNLTIGIDSGVSESIKSCEISGEGYSKNVAVSGGTITWKSESEDVPAGTYTFSFYDANDVLLYEFRESVLFFGALVTDSWFGSSAYITTDGECVITKTLVDKFALSRIYVSSKKSDSKETGSRAEPYKSVARAMNALLDKDTDYTILVDGELTGAQEIPASVTTANASSITIQGRTGSSTDKINGNNEGTALTIRTAVPVTIENLTITGGKASSNDGGGIYVAVENASLTLAQGCLVTENKAPSKNGGGVYIKGGRLALKDDAKVSKNEAYSEGGGIAVYSTDSYAATLEMSGTSSIENCKTTRSGGWWGGGILANGKESKRCRIELSESASIKGCSAKEGGGIGMIDFADLELKDDVEISGNSATSDGAGIRVWNSTAGISGGVIKNNAASYGGAVSVKNDGRLCLSGAAYIPYGVASGSGTEKGSGKNDVYFAKADVNSAGEIIVDGILNPPEAANGVVATITPPEWKRGTAAVKADGTNVGDISGYKNFFAFSEDGWEWKVSGDKKFLLLDAPVYVASKGTDSSRKVCAAADSFTGTATGSKSKPFATIEDALSVLNAESNVITIDGNVVGNQQILSSKVPSSVTAFTLAGYKESGAASSSAKLNGNGSGTVLTVNKSGLEVTVEGLTITGGNFSYGGGLAVDNGTVKLLDGAKITENTATEKGGGVYLSPSAKLVMEGSATISGNSAASGGAVYNAGSFNMGGSAYIPYGVTNASGTGKNDVYLESGKTIKITDELTTDELTYESYVIIITPEKYTDGTTVLEAESGVTLADEVGKFEVVPNGSTKYYIAFDGKMYKYKPATQFTTVPAVGDTAGLATMDDFEKVAEWVDDGNELTGVTLILLNDVTLDSSFTPVGEYNTNKLFTGGIFEGNNKTITYDNVSFTQKYSGIFSGAKNATIQNLNLEGTLNVNANYAGGVIGHAEACIIKNCSSSVSVTLGSSSQYGIGGIIGDAEGSCISGQKCERNCYILDCVNTSSIIADNGSYIGGIAGSARVCVIRNCINKGNISGVKACGGIVGVTTMYGPDNSGSLIENCGNNGNITATRDYFNFEGSVGGIAGGPTADNETWAPKINNCYSSGTITAKNNKAGGIFGYLKNRCTLSKCYYYNPGQACQDGSPSSGSSKYTSVSSILNDMNSLNSSDSATYRKWKVSGSILEFEE